MLCPVRGDGTCQEKGPLRMCKLRATISLLLGIFSPKSAGPRPGAHTWTLASWRAETSTFLLSLCHLLPLNLCVVFSNTKYGFGEPRVPRLTSLGPGAGLFSKCRGRGDSTTMARVCVIVSLETQTVSSFL